MEKEKVVNNYPLVKSVAWGKVPTYFYAKSKREREINNMNIVWKDIEGYEGIYLVSDTGLIRNISTGLNKKLTTGNHGYKVVNLWKGGEGTVILVHRLVAQAFIPNPDNKPEVNHKYGVKLYNHVHGLEWCTELENTLHAHRTGLQDNKGEKHYNSKLNNLQVRAIKVWLSKGFSCTNIAEVFDITRRSISDIKHGNTWKHVSVGGLV
jgi:hypothetical protein